MRVFLFDSTFEGLLSAVYDAYYSKDKPERIYSEATYEVNFIDTVVKIETDLEKFQKVYNAIEKKISKDALNKVYYTYLSEEKEGAKIGRAHV